MTTTRDQRRAYYLKNRERLIAKASAYQAAHPEMARAAKRRWQDANPFLRHGMQPTEWAEMFAAQEGRCYLCDAPLSDNRLESAIDHDHSCCPQAASCRYCRRGLACRACNLLIGLALDDPQRLRRIADNLEFALSLARERIEGKPVQESLI